VYDAFLAEFPLVLRVLEEVRRPGGAPTGTPIAPSRCTERAAGGRGFSVDMWEKHLVYFLRVRPRPRTPTKSEREAAPLPPSSSPLFFSPGPFSLPASRVLRLPSRSHTRSYAGPCQDEGSQRFTVCSATPLKVSSALVAPPHKRPTSHTSARDVCGKPPRGYASGSPAVRHSLPCRSSGSLCLQLLAEIFPAFRGYFRSKCRAMGVESERSSTVQVRCGQAPSAQRREADCTWVCHNSLPLCALQAASRLPHCDIVTFPVASSSPNPPSPRLTLPCQTLQSLPRLPCTAPAQLAKDSD